MKYQIRQPKSGHIYKVFDGKVIQILYINPNTCIKPCAVGSFLTMSNLMSEEELEHFFLTLL